MPDKSAQWLVGVFVAAGLGLAVQIDTQIGGLRDELRSGLAEARADRAEMRAEFRTAVAEIRTDLRRLDDRLRAVEITLG